ncbi:hypothetical protein ACIBCA_25285 [Kitasatospora sp. NPDC051170]|uniref:hypothetical protein n=1 Tax=Kitasatospora sp. NPDC051170 TaxID=3364056 RepID=UPI0037983F0E
MSPDHAPTRHVLLIGGAPGVGKSRAAEARALHLPVAANYLPLAVPLRLNSAL